MQRKNNGMAENAKPNPMATATGSFFCSACGKCTLHRMDSEGWKKGPCLECLARAEQLELFPSGVTHRDMG